MSQKLEECQSLVIKVYLVLTAPQMVKMTTEQQLPREFLLLLKVQKIRLSMRLLN